MSVTLNPSSALGFNRPFTTSVKRSLAISNPNANPVAFKVKTTAPKLYCVRPNSGRVEPGETVEVAVMLQAMKEDLPINAKCKDKFLIQSTTITPEKESLPLADIWNVEGDEVQSQKIRVVYLPPEGQTVPEEEEPGAPSMLLSVPGESRYDTVRQFPASNGNGYAATREHSAEDHGHTTAEEIHVDAPSTPPPNFAIHPPEPQPEPSQATSDDGAGVVNVTVHAPPPPAPAPVRRPSPPPSPPAQPARVHDESAEILKKLEDARAEIERLRSIISTMPEPSVAAPTTVTSATEFRRRRPAPSDDGTSTYDDRTEVGSYVDSEVLAQPDGVPLQVVIIIALGVFVTTYLFF